jgi:hypothetical protein
MESAPLPLPWIQTSCEPERVEISTYASKVILDSGEYTEPIRTRAWQYIPVSTVVTYIKKERYLKPFGSFTLVLAISNQGNGLASQGRSN